MKTSILFLLIAGALFSVLPATAQNTFPASGNTGIGTAAPVTLLQVSGAHGNTQARLTLPAANNGAGTGEVNLQLWLSEPGVTWEGGGIGANVTNNGGAPAGFARLNNNLGQAYIRFITNGGAMAFNTTANDGTYYQTMYMVNGNVGIGTTAPKTKFNVLGQALVSRDDASECCSGGDYTFAVAENTVATNRKAKISFHNSGIDEGSIELSREAGFRSIKFYDHQGLGLGLYVTGNVRIGNVDATKPGYKLFVEQGILTEKVKVAVKTSGDWSDHVFADDYKLLSIVQLEQFIRQNKHLPNIPSATEMATTGNNLGQTDARLLEKIEELTLYIIQQQKQIQQLEQKLNALNK